MISSLLFLGTGASMGVPVIGCECPVCRSKTPFNHRLRCSAYLKIGDKRLLIDVGPDFRAQALTHHIKSIDGILITHPHQDHVAGLDDLRAFFPRRETPFPLLMSKETAEDIKNRFYFLFKNDPSTRVGPRIEAALLPEERGEIDFMGIPIRYFSYKQLGMKVNGFRIGDLAYVTDIQEYPETLFEDLQGVNTLVLSALRDAPTHMHFTLKEASEFAQNVGAKTTYFTHIAHDLDHFDISTRLPVGIRPAYDGLEVPFTGI
jgi:phosphoribosyl 1,2-cyclic phosphate phosphodiesterase